MEIRVVTMEDLRQLKMELIEEMKEIFNLNAKNSNDRVWLKSVEVRQLLKISPGTLQNLRIRGLLPYRKIGGSLYYHRNDIGSMMERSNSDG
ncbi:helix-turn-helix domain-containing protein [Sphingobacterium endophyticum]|uniref:helix-turn-helix domain-containing protein n=1 Tax=Sphingobacterium endophyticum TaxID=2546448 RepID=UPI0012E12C01|nr:helix-turn-helix domain-containing protein [Sphingobacterium endophyticum]